MVNQLIELANQKLQIEHACGLTITKWISEAEEMHLKVDFNQIKFHLDNKHWTI